MNCSFPLVPLSEVATQRKEFIEINNIETYKRCRVQLHTRGIVLRDIVSGSQIKTKRQQICRAGELLVAEIDAKVGGFGIVPDDLDGAIVSSHYFLFEIDDSVLDRRFLGYFIRTPEFRGQVTAQGSTNYAAIRPRDVLSYLIPLPPIEEQHRIVAKIEALAGKIEEAQRLRQSADLETEIAISRSLEEVRHRLLCSNHDRRPLGDITTVTSGGTPSRSNPNHWGGTIPWIKTGELTDGDLSDAEEYITIDGLHNSSARLFPPDTVLIALYGQGQTRGRTGRLTVEAATNQACCAILPTPDILEARYTQYWLRSLYQTMRRHARDGAQPNWNGKMIKGIEIALPPLDEQRSVVAELDLLHQRIEEAKHAQAATVAELDALLPSILNKAFNGEL